MTDDEDEILAAELGKLGDAGGRMGATVGGMLGLQGNSEANARGGAAGAKWAGRRLRKNTDEIDMTLAIPLDETYVRVASLLGALGRVVAQVGPADGRGVVRGVLGAGAMNLNPAVVTVTMTSAGQGATTLCIRGAAKEGLIKQRAGEKAAQRVAAHLRKAET
jgi:hypothetical protein